MSATGKRKEWSDSAIANLRRLWGEGHATAEIGRRLGFSKNAIVGKAHRLDLPQRPSPIRRGQEVPPKPPRKRPVPKLADIMPMPAAPPVVQAPPMTHAPRPTPERVPAATGFAQCCWLIGHPGTPGFHFCRSFAVIGKPYCEEHCRAAYTRSPQRERRSDDATSAP